MTSVKLSLNSSEIASADAFLEMARSYEARDDQITAFGYYLIAASLMETLDGTTAAKLGYLAYRTGNFTFAIQCFVIAAADTATPKEKAERQSAIQNILKISGVIIQSAELTPVKLDFPPLIEVIPGHGPKKNRTCLLVGEVTDVRENVWSSMSEHSSLAGYVFRFSEIVQRVPLFSIDRFLLYLARDLSPDVLIFHHARLSWRTLDPRPETLAAIRERAGIPVVGVYYDLAKPSFERICRSYLASLDAVVPLDVPLAEDTARASGTASMVGWTPLPASIYFDRARSRPIDVGFMGRTSAHYQHREIFLQGLRDAGINVQVRGGDNHERLTIEEMGEFLRSCKIVLNFSSTPVISFWELHGPEVTTNPYVDHVKGRVFEAIACGALLLESRNSRTSAFFTPDVHYAEFTDVKDLIAKVSYFLAHDAHRERLAAAATQTFNARYAGQHFWGAFENLVDGIKRDHPIP
jgi:hypothetical protein